MISDFSRDYQILAMCSDLIETSSRMDPDGFSTKGCCKPPVFFQQALPLCFRVDEQFWRSRQGFQIPGQVSVFCAFIKLWFGFSGLEVLDGPEGGLEAVGNLDFFEDIVKVGFDRVTADVETVGNALV